MEKISAIETLYGTLSSPESLQGSLSVDKQLDGSLSLNNTSDIYRGDYRVTPKTDDVTELDTRGLLMADNVVIEKIPYRVNDNLSDGLTVYIGN